MSTRLCMSRARRARAMGGGSSAPLPYRPKARAVELCSCRHASAIAAIEIFRPGIFTGSFAP